MRPAHLGRGRHVVVQAQAAEGDARLDGDLRLDQVVQRLGVAGLLFFRDLEDSNRSAVLRTLQYSLSCKCRVYTPIGSCVLRIMCKSHGKCRHHIHSRDKYSHNRCPNRVKQWHV